MPAALLSAFRFERNSPCLSPFVQPRIKSGLEHMRCPQALIKEVGSVSINVLPNAREQDIAGLHADVRLRRLVFHKALRPEQVVDQCAIALER